MNTVGCGDALVGGLRRRPDRAAATLSSAAALGAAAATEKLAHLHPGRVERAAVEALVPAVEATPLRSQVALR